MLEYLEGLLDVLSGPLGMLGIFITSLIANSIPFVALPYLAVVLAYSLLIPDPFTKIVTAVVSALGATLGKLIIYSIGSLFRLGLSDKVIKNLELFNRIAGKSLFLAIFLFASLPLPDDILYIPTGMAKYSIFKYVMAVFLGKTALTSVVVFYSHLIKEHVTEFTFLLPVYVIVTIAVSYVIIKVDWAAVLNSLTCEGLEGGVSEFIKQLLTIFKLKQNT